LKKANDGGCACPKSFGQDAWNLAPKVWLKTPIMILQR